MTYLAGWFVIGFAFSIHVLFEDRSLKRRQWPVFVFVAAAWPLILFIQLCEFCEKRSANWRQSERRARWKAWWDQPMLKARSGKGKSAVTQEKT